METEFWQSANEEDLLAAAAIIKKGGLVAFPTETVYGLGANGLSGEAVAGIFAAKGRPSDNPLILHIADQSMLDQLVERVPPAAEKLMRAFWPGPLTLVLEKSSAVPDAVTAGLPTVAVRMPDHAVARRLIELSGLPLAAPSANLSGRPSPTAARAVKEDLDGRIHGIIDGGSTDVGLESTVVDCTQELPAILRPGGITYEQLAAVLGKLAQPGPEEKGAPKAPGMKYRHYAPRAPLYLLEAMPDEAELAVGLKRLLAQGKKAGMIVQSNLRGNLPAGVLPFTWDKEEELARFLYSWLRECDRQGAEVIFVQKIKSSGLGEAIMNRLVKAAEGKQEVCAADVAELLK